MTLSKEQLDRLREPWALDALLRVRKYPEQLFDAEGNCAHARWFYHPHLHMKVCGDCNDIDWKSAWRGS